MAFLPNRKTEAVIAEAAEEQAARRLRGPLARVMLRDR
jgi:hypothetical protein